MAKKSFRLQPGGPQGPRYPTLNELRPGALRRWGLAALGSLAVAGAGCWRTAGVPVPAKPAQQDLSGHGQAAPPDAGAPPMPDYPPPTGGVPPPVRIEDQGASRQRSGRPDKRERRKGQARQAAAAKRGIK